MSNVQKGFIVLLFTCCVIVYSNQLLDYFLFSRFLAVSILALIYISYLILKPGKIRSGFSLLDAVLSAFVLFSILSISWAGEQSEAILNAQKWSLVLALYFIFVFINWQIPKEQVWGYLSRVSQIFTTLILALVGYSLIVIFRKEGFSNEALYNLQILFGHKSLISSFIFLLLPLNLLAGFRESMRWPLLLLTAGQIATILILQSRAVYLSLFLFLIIMGVYLYQIRQDWKSEVNLRTISIILVILGAGFFFLLQDSGFRQRLDVTRYLKSQTATERQDVWRMSKPLIRDHLLLGVGGGNWKIEFPGNGIEGSYRMQDQNVIFTRAHNDFLEVLAELGLVGFLNFLAIFGLGMRSLHRSKARFPWQTRMLLTGLLGYIVASLIDFPKERIEFLCILALYLGLIEINLPRQKKSSVTMVNPRVIYMLLALVMAFNIYTGISHYRSERITGLMLKARSAEKWQAVIDWSEEAESFWHHLDPSSVPIAFYRGVAYYHLKQFEKAEQAFLEAHHYTPFNFHVLNNLATVALEKKDFDEAITWLQEALRINPRFEDALYNLSYCFVMQGAYENARETLESVPGESARKVLFRQEILRMQNQNIN